MADIFLSYAHEDEERIKELVHALEEHGWAIFWDRRIPTGKTWQSYIGQALSEAKCVIVAWSHYSVTSKWVIEEANRAEARGLLMPIFLDSVDPPLGFSLIQGADLTDWKAGSSSLRFDQLIQDIAGVMGGEPHRPAPEPELTSSTQPVATPTAVPAELPPHELTPPKPKAQKPRVQESEAIKPRSSQVEKKRNIPFIGSMVALVLVIVVGLILWSHQGPRSPQTRAVEVETPAATAPPVATLPVQPRSPAKAAVEAPAAKASEAAQNHWSCSASGLYAVCSKSGGPESCSDKFATGVGEGASQFEAKTEAENECSRYMNDKITIARLNGGGSEKEACKVIRCEKRPGPAPPAKRRLSIPDRILVR